MSILKRLQESSTVDSTNVEDYSGSVFVKESGFYSDTVKRAWAIESKGGAIGIHVEFEGEGMLETDIWMTNKEGQTFYNRNGKDMAMAGYVQMKKLNYVLTGEFLTSLTQLTTTEKVVKHYEWIEDPEDTTKKKKVDKEITVDYIDAWTGKELILGIQMKEKEESVKQGDKYVGTGKRAEDKDGKPYLETDIIGFYNATTNQTANEMKNEKEAEQIEKDKARIEKSPIRLFKAKAGGKAPTGKTSGGTAAVKKPSVF